MSNSKMRLSIAVAAGHNLVIFRDMNNIFRLTGFMSLSHIWPTMENFRALNLPDNFRTIIYLANENF